MIERASFSYWRLIRRFGLLWLVLPLVFGLVFSGVSWSLWAKYTALQRDGIVTQTEVIARDISRRRDSDGKETVSYFLTHRFRPESWSEDLTVRQSVSGALYAATQIGDMLPVTYVWNRPEVNALDPAHERSGAIVFGVIGALVLLVALVWLVWGARRLASIRRAVVLGDMRQARITDIRKLSVRVNKTARYRLAWVDATGKEGQSMMAPPDLALAQNVGDVIVVYVDPATDRAWWQQQV